MPGLSLRNRHYKYELKDPKTTLPHTVEDCFRIFYMKLFIIGAIKPATDQNSQTNCYHYCDNYVYQCLKYSPRKT